MGPLPYTLKRKYWLASIVVSMISLMAACGSSDAIHGAATAGSASDSIARSGVLPPTPTTVPLFPDSGLADPLDTVPETELVGILDWINSEPLEIDALTANGRVVLVDFWTYTCVNCIRTFPFLKQMHERYEPYGLTIIGVHSPEFDFEKIPENIENAVEAAGLTYPVAVDSDKTTWDLFGNHFWPTTYLIGSDGEVVYRHFGEGGYDNTEAQIRAALELAGSDLAEVPSGGDFTPTVVENAHTQTREIYAGYRLGYDSAGLFAAQDEFYLGPDRINDYVDGELRRHGQFELDGQWLNESNSLASAGSDSYIVFPFLATSVNAVLSVTTAPRTLEVQLDGKSLTEAQAGPDIRFDSTGRSFIDVTKARLYRVIETDEFRRYELKLTAGAKGLRVHSFTFGVFTEGP